MNAGQVCDIIIAVILLIGIIRGWMIGLAIKVGQVLALIASCLTAHIAGILFQKSVGKILIRYVLKGHEDGIFSAQIVKHGMRAFSYALAYKLIFMIVLFIALLVFHLLIQLLKIVDRIPVVGTLNKFGGALLGLVTEFIIIYIICAVLFVLIPQKTLNKAGLTTEVIRETTLLEFFAKK